MRLVAAWTLPLAFVALGPMPLAAQGPSDPIVTDRPDFTESPETVHPGLIQVEGGYTFSGTGREHRHAVGEILVRAPAAERLELRIGINSYVFTGAPGGEGSGLEDASLGFKVKLLEGAEQAGLVHPAAALIVAASVPTGSSAYRGETIQPEAKLAFGWSLAERASLASNLNFAALREDGDHFVRLAGSISFGYALSERVGSYLEAFGFDREEDTGPATGYLNGGLTLLVSPHHQIDVRAGAAVSSERTDYFFGVGAGVRW